ncbi:MAG: response regulator [Bacteroidota bacterium]
MNPASILIVEDNVVAAERLKMRLLQLGYVITDIARSGEETLQSIRQREPDLILLDIRLIGPLDGIETAYQIQQIIDVPIIFLTALDDAQTLVRANGVQPANYLTKPYKIKDIRVAIELAILRFSEGQQHESITYLAKDRFFIRKKDCFIRILMEDILWIEACGSYIDMHTKGKAPYRLSMTLKKFSSQFQHPNLLRVHRSFIINPQQVDVIKGRQFCIEDKRIPISEAYLPSVEQLWPIIRTL